SIGKFTNGQSLTAVFFVVIVDNVNNPKLAKLSRSWSLYPVFRCRRCVEDSSGRNHSNMDCCMVYVTEHGSFQNWDMFLRCAYYPSGYMVTPNRGVYKLANGQVELKTYPVGGNPSPSLRGSDRCIKPGTLKQSSCVVHRNQEPSSQIMLQEMLRIYPNLCTCDGILFQLLEERINRKLKDLSVADLSQSLVLFTHSVNNFRLATKMVLEGSCYDPLLIPFYFRSQFEKIAGDTSFINERVNPIRSANEVPRKADLDEIFKSVVGNCQKPIDEPMELLNNCPIPVKIEHINLKDYGQTLNEHILNTESFEALIASMSENLEPEMLKLIMKLTQNFMETTREELLKLLKYHFPTETVLYQILLCILKHHSNLDFKEVEDQSTDILRRVRYYFASACPNFRSEFLKKCPRCVGYYDSFRK
ncbi:hypothetical protein KR054_007508, partial [Drosophila jambulina]